MTLKFTALICGLMISSVAMAQDYGLTLGVHNTTATVDSTAGLGSGSSNSRLGYDLGLTASFELIPNLRFRSGVLYDSRQYDYKPSTGGTASFNYGYIDVPVNVQWNFTPMVGIYGGMIVGIKASDSTSISGMSGATPTINNNAKSLYPLLNAGVNFMFNDMIGFDVYAESGLGEFADHQKNFQTFGLHFIYWL